MLIFRKHHFVSPLLLASLVNLTTLAETENFNMALSGDFQKDSCTLSVGSDINTDINTGSVQGSEATVTTKEVNLFCTAGKRNVSVGNTEGNTYALLDPNTMIKQYIELPVFPALTMDTYQNRNGISSSMTALYNGVDFDGVNTLTLNLFSTIRVLDGDWTNTVENFDKTYSNVITIE